jgi:hypothetical protein
MLVSSEHKLGQIWNTSFIKQIVDISFTKLTIKSQIY